jgi:hypothetical protein
MKQCNKCNVDLVVGENWWKSSVKNSNYVCKGCEVKYRIKNKYPASKRKEWELNYRTSEGIGVYQIMLGEICMYVGEGRIIDRKNKHLKFSIEASSAVYRYCLKHNINRELLSFNVLEYENDEQHRKELEDWYITFLNPVINPTPPLKLFGDV